LILLVFREIVNCADPLHGIILCFGQEKINKGEHRDRPYGCGVKYFFVECLIQNQTAVCREFFRHCLIRIGMTVNVEAKEAEETE